MVRDHKLFVITYTYIGRISHRNASDDQVAESYEAEPSTATSRILAPSQEVAEAAFNDLNQSRKSEKSFQIVSIKDTGPLDAIIEKNPL